MYFYIYSGEKHTYTRGLFDTEYTVYEICVLFSFQLNPNIASVQRRTYRSLVGDRVLPATYSGIGTSTWTECC